MKKYILIIICSFFLAFGIDTLYPQYFGEKQIKPISQEVTIATPLFTPKIYTVDSFLEPDRLLENQVENILKIMTPSQKAGMVLMPAWEESTSLETILQQKKDLHLGGIFVLRKNFTQNNIQQFYTDQFAGDHVFGPIPLLYSLPPLLSVDAEPSLLYKNFTQIDDKIPNTNKLDTIEKSKEAGEKIATEMQKYGFNINFAPVYDTGKNTAIIGNRAFGKIDEEIQILATAFGIALTKNNIFPTGKHFPGHGNIVGDSHYTLPYIDGELSELENFQYAINKTIPIIMMGHIAIKNNEQWNTNGLPSSVSQKITTDLLKDTLGFQGLIITDAMNMKAVADIPNSDIKALKAGADIILMPLDAQTTHQNIVDEMQNNPEFEVQIDEKVRKILKMKLVLMNIE